VKSYKKGQSILITKGKNKGKIGRYWYFIDDNHIAYSLETCYKKRKIHVDNTEHYVRKFKGVPVTELCSVCWV